MKILITGGAGFIGSHICHKLIELGFKVNCIDNLSNGKLSNIKHLINNSNFTFYHEDILNLDEYHQACEVDMICHQASIGSVPRSIKEPKIYHENNVNTFFQLLEIARIRGIKRVVYASSSSVYGDDVSLPKYESNIGNVLSPYASTKRINEIYAKIYKQCYNLETIGLRYFNVFGPKQNPKGDYAAVIPKFIAYMINNESPIINGDGSISRDFTYVDNVVQANILALTTNNAECYGEEFNIGTGESISILDLFYNIQNILHSPILPIYGPMREGDILMSKANISKAINLMGYNPSINLTTDLKHTIKYFYENINNTTLPK